MNRSRSFFRTLTYTAALSISLAALTAPAKAADEFTAANGAGSKALLFTFGGLANMAAGSFNGGIGGRYYINDPMAIRGGLQFVSANQSSPANPPSGVTGTDGSVSATRFGLLGGLEYHFIKNRVSPYAGGLLSFSTTSTQSKTAVTGTTTQTTVKNRLSGETVGGASYTSGLGFGISGILGAEFFIVKEVSLGAEYQLGWSLVSQYNQETTPAPATGGTVKSGTLNTVGVASTGLLTLSFYF